MVLQGYPSCIVTWLREPRERLFPALNDEPCNYCNAGRFQRFNI